jgi:hypothetical protein
VERRVSCIAAILNRPSAIRYRALSIIAAVAALLSPFTLAAPATAQRAPAATSSGMALGDAAVTGFSGVVPRRPPAGGNPEDYFFIDRDGNSLVVFDLQNMKGPEDGRLVDAPRKLAVQAKQIGQVFGVTLDDRTPTPNIYATATSLYGLNIVNAQGKRVKKGGPGVQWMPGQFGTDLGGGPGSIWKIDGTGKVSLLANVVYQGKPNDGPGLGNIAFDPVSKHLFVSDLETGMVHRFDLNGRQIGTYDHGAAHRAPYDPAQRKPITDPTFDAEHPANVYWAPWERLVFGLAVSGGRLFYTTGEDTQIWSVAINANGSFGRDARLEIKLGNQDPILTDLAFGRDGTMYVGQRGFLLPAYNFAVMAKPATAPVLAFRKKAGGGWEAAQEYPIGFPAAERNTNGGVALGYGYDQRGVIRGDACERMLWSTGELLRLNPRYASRLKPGGPEIVQGLQGSDIGVVRPANVPPFKSYFLDFDGQFVDAGFSGHMGDVAIWSDCSRQIAQTAPPPASPKSPASPKPPASPPPAPSGQPDIAISKTCGPPSWDSAHCRVSLINNGSVAPRGPVQFSDRSQPTLGGTARSSGAPILSFTSDQQGVTCSGALPASSLQCTVPAALLQPGRRVNVDMFVDVNDVMKQPGWRVRNCVTMGNQTQCAEISGDLVISKSGPPTCIAGGICIFKITVKNNGRAAFDGPVLLADNLAITGARPGTIKVQSIRPALGCATTPARLPFACQSHMTLPAGGSRTFAVTVRLPMSAMPGPGKRFQARNCFMATDPSFIGDVKDTAVAKWAGGILQPGKPSSGLSYACKNFAISPAASVKKPPQRPQAGPPPTTRTPGTRPPQSRPPQQPRPRPAPKPKPKPKPRVECPADSHRQGKLCISNAPVPKVGCPAGTTKQGNSCVTTACSDDTSWDGYQCAPIDQPDCDEGQIVENGSCVCPDGGDTCVDLPDDPDNPDCPGDTCEDLPQNEDCPDGSVLDGESCVPADDPDDVPDQPDDQTDDTPDDPSADTSSDDPDEPAPDDPAPDDQPDEPSPDDDDGGGSNAPDDSSSDDSDEPAQDDQQDDSDNSSDEPDDSSDNGSDDSPDEPDNSSDDSGDDGGSSDDSDSGGGDDGGGDED